MAKIADPTTVDLRLHCGSWFGFEEEEDKILEKRNISFSFLDIAEKKAYELIKFPN